MVLLVLSFSDDDNIYRCSDFYDTISMMKNGGIANPIFHFNFNWKPLVFNFNLNLNCKSLVFLISILYSNCKPIDFNVSFNLNWKPPVFNLNFNLYCKSLVFNFNFNTNRKPPGS